MKKKSLNIIDDPKGQWAHPGKVTRIPSGNITMEGVPYPVLGVDNRGNKRMMYPGENHQFPGNSVTEYPQINSQQNISNNTIMENGGSPYPFQSQIPVMPHYNTGPLNQFIGMMQQGGSPYPVASQLPVMQHYDVSPQAGYTFYKQGGNAPCIPCILDQMQHMQKGGSSTFGPPSGGGAGPGIKEYYDSLPVGDIRRLAIERDHPEVLNATVAVPQYGNPETSNISPQNYFESLPINDPRRMTMATNYGFTNQPPSIPVTHPQSMPAPEQYNTNHIYGPDIIGYNPDGSPIYRQFNQGQQGQGQPQIFYPNPKGTEFVGNNGQPQGAPKSAGANRTLDMQKKLNAMGAHIAEDGKWGPKTQAAYDKYMGGKKAQYPAADTEYQGKKNVPYQQGGPTGLDEFDQGGNWIGKASDNMDKKGTKGSFTSYCGGKVTEECIKRGLASSNPTTRKRAAFAKAMHHIAKKKTGGDVPAQYEGENYLQKHNDDFINHIAQNYSMHVADSEIDNMEELHKKIFGGTHYQTGGGVNTPLGSIFSQTSTDPMGTPIDLAPNPVWNIPQPNVQIPGQYPAPVMMDPNQLQGRPVTSAMQPQRHTNWFGSMAPVQQANGILAGTSGIAGMLENAQRRKQDMMFRQRMGADNSFTPVPGSAGSRGDYDTNSGMFRPNNMVPVQFPGGAPTGYGYHSYKHGGEYYMSEADVQRILADGGEIEYID